MRITFGLIIGFIVCLISTEAATSNEFYKNEPMFEMKDKNPSNEPRTQATSKPSICRNC